ncbi:MAG: hypothetical protein WA658_24130, partial [Candidatus Acidiferrales bacterium]
MSSHCITHFFARRTSCAFFLAAAALCVTGCNSGESAGQMTSFSGKEAKSAEAELFTIPQEQMSHVQVVTVAPTKLA